MADPLGVTEEDIYSRGIFTAAQMTVVKSRTLKKGERASVLKTLTEVRNRGMQPNPGSGLAPVQSYTAIIFLTTFFLRAIGLEFLGVGMESLDEKTYDLTDCSHKITVRVTLIAGKGKQVVLYAFDEEGDRLLELAEAAGFRDTPNTWVFLYPMYREVRKERTEWKVAPTGTRGEKIVLAACDRWGDQREALQCLDAAQDARLASLNPDRARAFLASVNICKPYNFRLSRDAIVGPADIAHLDLTRFYGFNEGTPLGPINMKFSHDRTYSECFKSVDNDPGGDGETLTAFLAAANIWSCETAVFCPVRGGGPGEEGYFVALAESVFITVSDAEEMFNGK
jgi:hypothetical protein